MDTKPEAQATLQVAPEARLALPTQGLVAPPTWLGPRDTVQAIYGAEVKKCKLQTKATKQ